jgi:tetratricopeptide (TPR) repeat protein
MNRNRVDADRTSILGKLLAKLVMVTLLLAVMPAQADGGDGSDSSSDLAGFRQLIDKRQFQQAIDEIDVALRERPNDADLLNLKAYSLRQLQDFDSALEFYRRALAVEPKHRGANEYLGELYLRLGQLEKAEERLSVLDKACFFGCDEFDELEQAIEEYRRENPS